MIFEQWNPQNYQIFLSSLREEADLTYQKFHGNLLGISFPLIGIRTPRLKELAKQIARTSYRDFLSCNTHDTYEEITLHGFVLCYVKEDFKTITQLLDEFLPYINNWATCDLICSNLKIMKKETELGFSLCQRYYHSSNPWIIRFSLVLYLSYFMKDEYIDSILEQAFSLKREEYYVKMANAWLICMCYINFKEKTLVYLKKNTLDDWTHNKAIQKIKESNRIQKEEKIYLNTLKRKH